MTEDEAIAWLHARYDGGAMARLERFVAAVRHEADRQNLVAPSTLDLLWSRHVVDSAQLDALVAPTSGTWLDVGTGAGFPGFVIACVRSSPVILVEPRRRRATFLAEAAESLGLNNVQVIAAKVEQLTPQTVAVISARAVASLDALFTLTAKLRTSSTQYVLPRGSGGRAEVEATRSSWQGMFHVEHSVTDSQSVIAIASGVERRCTA